MLKSGDLDFSFSGLKTAVLTLVRQQPDDEQTRADIARAFQDAIVDVLAGKALAALKETGHGRLVVAGGVGANRQLRDRLDAGAAKRGATVAYPRLAFCTDNGAMIAYAAARRLASGAPAEEGFTVRPRWDLADLPPAD